MLDFLLFPGQEKQMISQKSKAGEESFMVLREMKVKKRKRDQCTYFQQMAFLLIFQRSCNLITVYILLRDFFSVLKMKKDFFMITFSWSELRFMR